MTGLLRDVLGRYPPASRPDSEPSPLGNAGGLSGSSLWRFEAPRGELVLRAWPPDGPDRNRLATIHAWLKGARGLGFLPVPIASGAGPSVVEAGGRLWDLSPWMPGRAPTDRPPPPDQIRAMFDGLARFHDRLGLGRSPGPSPGLRARFAEVDRLILGEFEAIRRAVARSAGDPRAILARSWLDRARPLAPGLLGLLRGAMTRPVPLQPCLRDARPDHFLFEGNRLVGLVDFGAMGVDVVAGDLARLMSESLGPDSSSRAIALEAYRLARPPEAEELATIPAFERANALLGPARWARWHFLERRAFQDPEAVLRGLRRGLERLDEAGPW